MPNSSQSQFQSRGRTSDSSSEPANRSRGPQQLVRSSSRSYEQKMKEANRNESASSRGRQSRRQRSQQSLRGSVSPSPMTAAAATATDPGRKVGRSEGNSSPSASDFEELALNAADRKRLLQQEKHKEAMAELEREYVHMRNLETNMTSKLYRGQWTVDSLLPDSISFERTPSPTRRKRETFAAVIVDAQQQKRKILAQMESEEAQHVLDMAAIRTRSQSPNRNDADIFSRGASPSREAGAQRGPPDAVLRAVAGRLLDLREASFTPRSPAELFKRLGLPESASSSRESSPARRKAAQNRAQSRQRKDFHAAKAAFGSPKSVQRSVSATSHSALPQGRLSIERSRNSSTGQMRSGSDDEARRILSRRSSR